MILICTINVNIFSNFLLNLKSLDFSKRENYILF
jgi:hypothetical protein